MDVFKIVPTIYCFDDFKAFNEEFKLGKGDIVVTNRWMYDPYIAPLGVEFPVVFQEKYGSGEPSDEMIDSIAEEMAQYEYDRIIALGGGTIIDICKVLALEPAEKSIDLFTGKKAPKKIKELIVIPSTCGTGSEVTNVAIAELKSLHTKKGIAVDETYADKAVLIPECLEGLPDAVFATSSIDALIHASESYLSPKANPFTEMYSIKAIEMIINGYIEIVKNGNNKDSRAPYLKDFALASDYAGIAFGNAGCAAVHALSYAIGGAFHVPHGEANYQFFTEVFKTYMKKDPDGKIDLLNQKFADLLGCDKNVVYDKLEELLDNLLSRKPLKEYGMTEDQIDEFTVMTIDNQQRLLANNYVFLDKDEIREIFNALF